MPTAAEREALSFFSVSNASDSAAFSEAIEPLHGVARHPFAAVGCKQSSEHKHDANIFNISYLIVHNDCGRRDGPKPRTLLFDLGASIGFDGIPGGIFDKMPTKGGGRSHSLPLFYRMYADRCLEPDAVFAWEPNPRTKKGEGTDRDWWGELPASIRAKTRFYHDFVVERELGAEGPHPPNSFLAILEQVARPDDFVAIKVDMGRVAR